MHHLKNKLSKCIYLTTISLAFLFNLSPLCGEEFLYVVNRGSEDMSVVSTSSNSVIATIPLLGRPIWPEITPDGKFIYVTNEGATYLSVVETATNTLFTTIPMPTSNFAAITSNGKKLYVIHPTANQLSVVDVPSNTVSKTITTLGTLPIRISILPDDSKAYVSNIFPNTVSVIDIATDTVSKTIPVPPDPSESKPTPDGKKVYVCNRGSDVVTVIDTATDTVSKVIPVGDEPFTLLITPDGAKVYIFNAIDTTASIIDTTSDTVVATVTVGTRPRFGVYAPNQNLVYGGSQDQFYTIDNSTNTFGSASLLGVLSGFPVINGNKDKIYVTMPFLDSISVVNPATNTLITSIPIGTRPNFMVITPGSTGFSARKGKVTFLTQTERVNKFSWALDEETLGITHYNIFRDGILIAVVPAEGPPMEFIDHNIKKNAVFTYVIVAIGPSGQIATETITL